MTVAEVLKSHKQTLSLDNLSVIVPTKNESKNIETFLGSVPDGVELIVVDASDDNTVEIIEKTRPERTAIINEDLTIPQARQRGAELATTDWLLYTDADVVFCADYFDVLTTVRIDCGSVGGVVGTKSSDEDFGSYDRFFLRAQKVLDFFNIPAASGSNMLIRRDVLFEVGGFDPSLTVNEDTEVMFRVNRSSHKVLFVPELVVRGFDHRRLEAGLIRKVVHGAIRNTCLFLGILGDTVRASDWGYWADSVSAEPKRPQTNTTKTRAS